MQNRENPILRENRLMSGKIGSSVQIAYKGRRGAVFTPATMSVPPRSKPDDDSWYMNPTPPSWNPENPVSSPRRTPQTQTSASPYKWTGWF